MRKLNRMLDAIARLSYVPATGKEEPWIYILPHDCVVRHVAGSTNVVAQESVGVTASKADAEAAKVLDKGVAKCS